MANFIFKRDESPVADAGNCENVSINNSSSFKYKSSIKKTQLLLMVMEYQKMQNSCSIIISKQLLAIIRNEFDELQNSSWIELD